jgi:hypothetical protein
MMATIVSTPIGRPTQSTVSRPGAIGQFRTLEIAATIAPERSPNASPEAAACIRRQEVAPFAGNAVAASADRIGALIVSLVKAAWPRGQEGGAV